jgi:AcrR family transcriptional regulator
MRRVATEIGVTQPVIYSVFTGGRQALIDAVALSGFDAIATALEAVPAQPMERMQAYLEFAASQPRVYEAMFLMPSGLEFGTGAGPDVLQRAFAGIRDAFPGPDVAEAEVAWASVHGLATLEISKRLPLGRRQGRLSLVVERLMPATPH